MQVAILQSLGSFLFDGVPVCQYIVGACPGKVAVAMARASPWALEEAVSAISVPAAANLLMRLSCGVQQGLEAAQGIGAKMP